MSSQAQAQDAAANVADAGRAFAEAVGARIEAQLSTTLVAASSAAVVKATATTSAGGAVREVLADSSQVSAALAPALSEAEDRLEAELLRALMAALGAGWRAGVAEQDALLPEAVRIGGDRVEMRTVEAALMDWPIVGNTAPDIAAHNAAVWRFAAAGVLGVAVSSGAPAGIVPGLADAARAAGNRATTATAEAFQAGVGAARLAAGEALRRALT